MPAENSVSPDQHDPQTSWSRQVKSAIERLRDDLDSETMDEEQRARCQVCLSLLHLAVEDPEKAVEALEDLDDQQLEFWRQTVLGMGILLDPNELPKFRHRVESAAEHFSRGVTRAIVAGTVATVEPVVLHEGGRVWGFRRV